MVLLNQSWVFLLWQVSFPLVVTKLGNEKRNQMDKMHILAWEKRGNNNKILKGRRPFERYMIVS